MNIFDCLIGAQILKMTNDGFSVRLNNGETMHFEFIEGPGDCCGYSDIQTTLFYDEESKENPIITKVHYEENGMIEGESLTITFFGAYAPLAKIDSLSSSDSGWCYGSSMSVICKETKEEEILTAW